MADLFPRRGLEPVMKQTTTSKPHCAPFTLPSGGHILLAPTSTITLTADVLFTPECNPTETASAIYQNQGISGITDVKDPFYASVTPQVYATAAATVLAWMLVIMLLITPRTYFVGGAGGGFGILNRHGMISGAQGGVSVIGVGSRPWLQKVAALTAAVSLTIATADTFKVAEQQYAAGFMNAEQLRSEVVNSTEIQVTRIVSDVFLWLAQVQTLIRLFPRHKEKVLIKWIGFALIILDAIFSTLNSFMGNPIGRPREFRDAIPALNYLFELSLSMLYAAWVIYYALCKRKYAFYHKDMWNVMLVALLSIVAILTPVIFFITDIANESIAGWGDYFRWVGAAAASVIVWEWVERIEALEREEKKDGILGREVFDGDEMIDSVEPEQVIWPRPRGFWAGQGFRRRGRRGGGDGGYGGTGGQGTVEGQLPTHSTGQAEQTCAFFRTKAKRSPNRAAKDEDVRLPAHGIKPIPTPPPVAVSPISRADTTSPASTVYTIRYHNINTPIPAATNPQNNFASLNQTMHNGSVLNEKLVEEEQDDSDSIDLKPDYSGHPRSKFHVSNPFKRKKALPPEEVRAGQVIDPVPINTTRAQPSHQYSRWDIKGRLGAFAAEQGEKWLEKKRGEEKEKDLPVTIIPAQPRGRTWSPDATLNLPTEAASQSPSIAGQDRSGLPAADLIHRVYTGPSSMSTPPASGLSSPRQSADSNDGMSSARSSNSLPPTPPK
ncbi:uncharacterized protein PV09_05089 [Verruconis gallopava]|uniref:PH-response regulator protein palH/RIM21 n=1 Tax=Verruconis gallopava TaxID=253628 RepID=A0A0D1XML9_9PEZI|nr:uncharacterized protein PV09_05089 [Verruconis gallopava]KIW03786.1 hypothetical protein PV09_05089 [Verruconis gallopava]